MKKDTCYRRVHIAGWFLIHSLHLVVGQEGVFTNDGSGSDPCNPSPCGVNEVCVDIETPVQCICKEGFKGTNCLERVNCADPGEVPNGVRAGTDFNYQQSVTYTCNTGYTLTGSATRTCLISGQWSGSQPTCTAVDCGFPGTLQNGVALVITTTFGSSAFYECNSGYYMSGFPVLKCTATKAWDNNPPTCLQQTSNPCEPSPCGIYGVCVANLDGSSTCTCKNSYSGPTCQTGPDATQLTVQTYSLDTYVDAMSDQNSKEFKETCAQLKFAYEQVLISLYPDTFLSLECISIKPGSLVAEFLALFDPVVPDTTQEMKVKFNKGVDDYRKQQTNDPLYVLEQSRTIISNTGGTIPVNATGQTGDLSPLYIIVGIVGLLLIILTVILAVYRRRKRVREYRRFLRDRESSESYGSTYASSMGRRETRPIHFWRQAPAGMAADYNIAYASGTGGHMVGGRAWPQTQGVAYVAPANGYAADTQGNGLSGDSNGKTQQSHTSDQTYSWATVSSRRPKFGVNLWSDTWARRPKNI